MRNHVSRNNVKKKHAGYSGRPLSSTGRRRRARTRTSPACIGGRNLRFIERPPSTRHRQLTNAHERGHHGHRYAHLCICDSGTGNCGCRHIHEGQVAAILPIVAESSEDLVYRPEIARCSVGPASYEMKRLRLYRSVGCRHNKILLGPAARTECGLAHTIRMVHGEGLLARTFRCASHRTGP